MTIAGSDYDTRIEKYREQVHAEVARRHEKEVKELQYLINAQELNAERPGTTVNVAARSWSSGKANATNKTTVTNGFE